MHLRGFLFSFVFLLMRQGSCLEIAFFIKKDAQGSIEVYERNSPYSHVAMRVGNKWLNAHPWRGIEITDDLRGMGDIVEIFESPEIPEPDIEFLEKVVGKRYFIFADWHDDAIYNCAKLVGKYLGLEPLPMQIDHEIWQGRFQEYNGKPGLSPGELYVFLSESDFVSRRHSDCFRSLNRN